MVTILPIDTLDFCKYTENKKLVKKLFPQCEQQEEEQENETRPKLKSPPTLW